MRTEIGKIQANVQEAKEDEEKTPLGQKIDAFGALLARDRTWENGLRWHASHPIPRVASYPSPPLRRRAARARDRGDLRPRLGDELQTGAPLREMRP